MASFEFLAIILTGIGLTVSILYYTFTLQNANKTRELQLQSQEHQLETRQAQIFLQYVRDWNEVDFKLIAREIIRWEWTDFDDFKTKYYDDLENSGKLTSLGMFMESLGIMVQKGLIDVELAFTVFGGYVVRYWEKFKEIEYETRERYNWPQSGIYLEYLYNEFTRLTHEKYPELKTQKQIPM
ncbi:hypothetical protein JXL21_06735 [Candidatus Bathyarchaeota archaeon]|nr:hypothetical protein [Candidatus Bathyarchaeota archaeon]